jgi:O-antigen/teichoic acid export membrane protein
VTPVPSTATTAASETPHRTHRYLTNVLWTWLGVAAGIVSAFLLQPYTIRKLGDVDVSIWMLTLSVVEYYWLIDLGFRSATMKMSAQFRAEDQPDSLNELLSTGVAWSSIMAVGIIVLTVAIAPYAEKIWHLNRPVFRDLILIAGISWALGMVFNVFGACVEGFQRFDLLGRIWITTTVVRSSGVALVLFNGRGLLEMGFVLLGAQLLSYLLTYLSFRRVLPGARISRHLASFSMLKEMVAYGIHTFTTIVSTRLLNQGLPAIIGYFLPIQSVVYYTTPMRIMDYAMDGIGRVGQVTAPNATELMTRNRLEEMAQLGIYANRYCLSLFLPLVSMLLVYGFEVYSLWVRPSFAVASAYLLPVMLISHAAVSGQFNSVSILFGMGRHKTYSRCLLAEALITAGGMAIVLPRYGLYGGAILAASTMIANRSFVVCFLVCRELKIGFAGYAAKIYLLPLAIAAGATVLLLWIKRMWLPGSNWGQVVLAGTLMLIPYAILTFRFCFAEHHREVLWSRLRVFSLGFARRNSGK